ncbi:MAG TPA: hypothetical protein VGC88_04795, partial [Terriglobales bacterium]
MEILLRTVWRVVEEIHSPPSLNDLGCANQKSQREGSASDLHGKTADANVSDGTIVKRGAHKNFARPFDLQSLPENGLLIRRDHAVLHTPGDTASSGGAG